jgi:FKBP-type peptidyl-prolyl cis-trans isomerase FklB
MRKLEKTVLTILVGVVVTTTQGFSQAPKTPAKPVAAVRKTSGTAARPATAANKPTTSSTVLKSQKDSLSAAIGVSFSNTLASQGITDINTEVLTRTITQAMNGGKPAFSPEEANQFIGNYFQKLSEEKGAVVKVEGEKFLEENKKKPETITTASGLQYQVIKMGEGAKPTATDKVKTHYHGTLINGTVFDSSVERGEPIEFGVGGVIKGWTEALQLMPVGSKWKLFIPYQLAYGSNPAGPQIPAYSALVFEVELLDIVK